MVMFLVALACWFVCLGVHLFVCLWATLVQRITNGLQWHFMEGSRVVQGRTLNFGGDPGLLKQQMSKKKHHNSNCRTISWSGCRQWSRSFGVSLTPRPYQGPRFNNVYCQAATNLVGRHRGGVMIYLNQGSLCSPSSSSSFYEFFLCFWFFSYTSA